MAHEWQGYQAVHVRPAAYYLRRVVTVDSATFIQVDLRTIDWFGQAPRLNAAARAAAIVRGIARQIWVKIQDATAAGDWARYADRANPNGEYYGQVDRITPILISDYPTNLQVSDFWWATNGPQTLETEIWFDIPPAGSTFIPVVQ